MMRNNISDEKKREFSKIGLPVWQKSYHKNLNQNLNQISPGRRVETHDFREKPTDFSELP